MWSPLIGVYLVCLGIGFIYVLISLLMGEIGAHADFSGADHGGFEVDHGDVGGADAADIHGEVGDGGDFGHDGLGHVADIGGQHLPLFSPLIIASFLASFGAMGLVARYALGFGDLASFVFAMPTAMALAVAIFFLVAKLLFGSAASSEATLRETLGAQAEVLVTIPAGGIGEIVYHCKGFRYKAPARSQDGQSIQRGAKVRIVKTDGPTMTVRGF